MIWVYSIGVEIECGFNSLPRRIASFLRNFYIGTDGSVSVGGRRYPYEEIKGWFLKSRRKKFYELLREDWAEAEILQNSTCGNHFHLRFHNERGKDCTEEVVRKFTKNSYWRDFLQRYKRMAQKREDPSKYLKRIDNGYCRFSYELNEMWHFEEDGIIDRYRAINLAAYDRHKTLEIRILPYADNAEEYIRNLEWLIHTIERVLNKDQPFDFEFELFTNNPSRCEICGSDSNCLHKRRISSLLRNLEIDDRIDVFIELPDLSETRNAIIEVNDPCAD